MKYVIIVLSIFCGILVGRLVEVVDDNSKLQQELEIVHIERDGYKRSSEQCYDLVRYLLVTYTQRTVIVSAYTPRKIECDDDPYITASGVRVREGGVAVSRDLFWAGWTYGKKVYVDQLGIFTITDVMNERWTDRIDVFMWNLRQAKQFGVKKGVKAVLLNI
jgi:3D (Asp-Asp-Asp) domain-containing protein